ncbi:MAG: hypothetical protein Fur006_70300 [Coleofasciculaceae cyanobacterium]
MNVKYLATLMPIVLATGLLQPIARAQGIPQITISGLTSIERQISNRVGSNRDRQTNTDILFLGRDSKILVSRQEDPSLPRPSPPGGGR